MPNGSTLSLSHEVEDALMYLPRKGVTDYSRGVSIFDENNPSKALHLVLQGKVKVTIPVENGAQTVIDIFNTDDFFGESGLLGGPPPPRTRDRSGKRHADVVDSRRDRRTDRAPATAWHRPDADAGQARARL